MINRFNFYDIYGFLFPGLTLIGLIGLPFVACGHGNVHLEFASAAAAAVVGYVLGHIVQLMSKAWIPWTWRPGSKKRRQIPSNIILDERDSKLAPELKIQLAAKIQERFKLSIAPQTSKDVAEVDRVRRAAFYLCRRDLLNTGRADYAEQFEGLYAMMGGLATAFGAGAFYYAGFAFLNKIPCVSTAHYWLPVALLAWLGARLPQHASLLGVWSERAAGGAALSILGGYVFWKLPRGDHFAGAAISISIACGLIALAFLRAYGTYTYDFAMTVYRDFMVEKPEAQG